VLRVDITMVVSPSSSLLPWPPNFADQQALQAVPVDGFSVTTGGVMFLSRIGPSVTPLVERHVSELPPAFLCVRGHMDRLGGWFAIADLLDRTAVACGGWPAIREALRSEPASMAITSGTQADADHAGEIQCQRAGDGLHTCTAQVTAALASMGGGSFLAAVVFPALPAAMVLSDGLGRQPMFYRCGARGFEVRVHRPPLADAENGEWLEHTPRTLVLLQAVANEERFLLPRVLSMVPLLPPPTVRPPLPAHLSNCSEVCTPGEKEDVISALALEFLARTDVAVRRVLALAGSVEEPAAGSVNVRPPARVAVLFSGGVDSSLLAALCIRNGADVRLVTAGFWDEGLEEPEDIVKARAAAEWLGAPWTPVIRSLDETLADVYELAPIIADVNVVKMGVALTFSAACREAASQGCSVVLSGGGSEELLSGYHWRHLQRPPEASHAAGLSGLRSMYHRDLQRDFAVGAMHGQFFLHPYLDADVAPFALALPPDSKVAEQEKRLLRRALQLLGAPPSLHARKKRAAQYGSRFHSALAKLAKRHRNGGLRTDLVCDRSLGSSHCSLALVFTSGKESAHCFQTMCQVNCSFVCILGFSPVARAEDDLDDGPHMRRSANIFAKCAGLPYEAVLPHYVSRSPKKS